MLIRDRRHYRDDVGEITASWISPSKDNADRNHRVQGFLYADKPLKDVAPEHRGRRYSNETTERVGIARALLSLGVSQAVMHPLKPPQPDMLVATPEHGEFFAEFTMGMDDDEQSFQSTFQEFAEQVDDRFSTAQDGFLNGRNVSIGFIEAPPRTKHKDLSLLMEQLIRASDGRGGRHEIVHPEMKKYALSFLTSLMPDAPGSVTGAGLAFERGMADYYDVMLRRLREKRDIKRYEAGGRPLWIVLSVGLPLVSFDALPRLFRTDIRLGHVDRIIVDANVDLLLFERSGLRS